MALASHWVRSRVKRYSTAYDLQTICLRLNHNWYLSRKEAEMAACSGWAKEMAVEQLWKERHLKVLGNSGAWPVPGPPPLKISAVGGGRDARDAAQAGRRAIENSEIRCEVFLIDGVNTCSTIKIRELVAK